MFADFHNRHVYSGGHCAKSITCSWMLHCQDQCRTLSRICIQNCTKIVKAYQFEMIQKELPFPTTLGCTRLGYSNLVSVGSAHSMHIPNFQFFFFQKTDPFIYLGCFGASIIHDHSKYTQCNMYNPLSACTPLALGPPTYQISSR